MRSAKIIAALFFGLLLTGCATNGDIRKLDSEIAAIRSESMITQRMAEDAKKAADEANARSKSTEEMLNRSFKKSMYK